MGWMISKALMDDYESSRCSQEREAESSPGNCSDGERSVPLSSTPTPQAYCSPDRMTECSKLSRYGMTFAPLTGDRGEDVLTWFRGAFPVKTCQQQQAERQELQVSVPGCGLNSLASFARFDRDTHSWKTLQCSLLGDSESYSETWPQWGLIHVGVCWEQTKPALPISENESGFWPTPLESQGGYFGDGRPKLEKAVKMWPTPVAHDDGKTPEAQMRMKAGMKGGARHKPTSLNVVVKGVEMGMWPTPLASDGKSGGPNQCGGKGDLRLSSAVFKFPTPRANDAEKRGNFDLENPRNGLPAAVKRFPTPTARDWKSGCASEETRARNSRPLSEHIGGQLNPTWEAWLMGWPHAIGWDWTSLEPAPDEILEQDWSKEPDGIPRVAKQIPARVHRVKALGNGQVPQCAAMAWRILTEGQCND